MTTDKVTIDRELLERLLYVMDNYVTHETPEEDQLRAILAAPRQPEGEGQEPVAFYWQDVGYKNPNRHGPYFGRPTEAALRNVDGGAIPVPLYTAPQPSSVPDGVRKVIDYLSQSLHQASDGTVPCGEDAIVECIALLEHASAPATVPSVNQQLLEALTDSLELMETLCAFEGDTIRKARAAIAAAREEVMK